MYVYMSFMASKNRSVSEFGQTPGVEMVVNSEAEFHSILGQLICRMIELYNQAASHEEKKDELADGLSSNARLLALVNWIRDTQPLGEWVGQYVLVLGWGWKNEVDFISKHMKMLNFKDVFGLVLDPSKSEDYKAWEKHDDEEVVD